MKITSNKKNEINVNGDVYYGNSVSIVNGKVFIDGVEQTGKKGDKLAKSKKLEIHIHGDVENVESEAGTIKAQTIHTASTQSGDIEADVIKGNASTMSGDIEARVIEGNTETMSGDIIQKRRIF